MIVERYMDGPELAGVVFDDGRARHVFVAQKKFKLKPDGKHSFTSIESYGVPDAYKFELVEEELEKKVAELCAKAFDILRFSDYAKFDIRLDEKDQTPYFIDCNPNTSLGPDKGEPMTAILGLYGIEFKDIIACLLSKHVKSTTSPKEI